MTGGGIDWDRVKLRLDEGRREVERVLEADPGYQRAIFRQRAARLAARKPAEAEETLDVLVFWLGDECCALELTAVAEVLPFRGLTPVPGAPPELLGVVNLRGTIRPVLDLCRVTGAGGGGNDGYVLFLRDDGPPPGVRVDRVEAVKRIRIGELAADDRKAAMEGHFVKGLTQETLILLDAEAVRGALAAVLGTGRRGS